MILHLEGSPVRSGSVTDPPDALIAALRAGGLRVTAARRAICSVIAESVGEHLSAADIQARAAAVLARPVDASTVYRTLDVLEQLGHLHHVHLGHGPGLVHLSAEADHHHLVCDVCGRTEDLPLAKLAPLLGAVEEEHGFVVEGGHFALTGRCADCVSGNNR